MQRTLLSFIAFMAFPIVLVSLIITSPSISYASPTDTACQLVGDAASGSPQCQQNGSNPLIGPNGIITKIINIITILAGAASVVMVVISGIMFVNSHGDSNSVKTARNTLMYAIIGLIIVVIAQTLVRFVLSRVVK